MKCPHCLENFFEDWLGILAETGFRRTGDIVDVDATWVLEYCICPSCKKAIIRLRQDEPVGFDEDGVPQYRTLATQLVKPKTVSRAPLPAEVPSEFATDYREACLVLADSPKASAALSRRCLQALLVDKGGATKRDLFGQIQQVVDSGRLPSDLAEGLDAVRNIGNFAAHPMKSTNTGEVIEVEPGEAEWNLEILEDLFDFYFVRPSRLREKKQRLNRKLQDAGKPPMKTTGS